MSTSALLRDLPEQLETERLLLRCPRAGDGPMVYEGTRASLQALRQFPASLPWAQHEPSVAASELYCRESHAASIQRRALPLLILRKADGRYLGGSGLHTIDWQVPKCEIGYWLRSDCTGQGLVTDAVLAITRWALQDLGMRRIEALPDEANADSCRVCERAGYTLEGVRRNHRIDPDGTLRHTRVYAITTPTAPPHA